VPKKITHTYSWIASLGFSVLIFGVFSLTQMLILIFCLLPNHTLETILIPEFLESQIYNFIGPISIYSSIIGLCLVIAASRFMISPYQSFSFSIKNILPINKPSLKSIIKWLLILIGFSLFIAIISSWLNFPNEADFTNQVLSTSGSFLLLFYGIGIAQPIFEEFLFRGLLFKGLEQTLGGALTVFSTSVLFVLPHIQYDFFILSVVLFPNALILGYARLKTKSLTIPILLHCTNNILTLTVGILN